jgi:Ran-binding protein 1
MKLTPNVGSDRSWVWQCAADFAENPATEETLALRVKNSEQAGEFKAAFEQCAAINALIHSGDQPDALAAALAQLKVVEAGAGESAREEEPDVKPDDNDDDGDDN